MEMSTVQHKKKGMRKGLIEGLRAISQMHTRFQERTICAPVDIYRVRQTKIRRKLDSTYFLSACISTPSHMLPCKGQQFLRANGRILKP